MIRGLVLVVALGLPGLALAQGVPPPPAPPSQMRATTLEELARDLDSESPGVRGFAARELRRRARIARRQYNRARPGSIQADEARVLLADLRGLVVPSAIECVQGVHGVKATCAQILGAIGDKRGVGPMLEARDKATGRAKKKIDKALTAIEEAT